MDEEWRLNSSKKEESKDNDVKAGRVFNPYKPVQQVTQRGGVSSMFSGMQASLQR